MIEHLRATAPEATIPGVLVNWYDGTRGDYIAAHSDNEASIAPKTEIASISFGQVRRMKFKPQKQHMPQDGNELVIELNHGDLVIMGGTCQFTHLHEIMKVKKRERTDADARRINFTIRMFKNLL